MRGLDPRIHLLREKVLTKIGWIAGSSPAMTTLAYGVSRGTSPAMTWRVSTVMKVGTMSGERAGRSPDMTYRDADRCVGRLLTVPPAVARAD